MTAPPNVPGAGGKGGYSESGGSTGARTQWPERPGNPQSSLKRFMFDRLPGARRRGPRLPHQLCRDDRVPEATHNPVPAGTPSG
jgi:hypothetical protein